MCGQNAGAGRCGVYVDRWQTDVARWALTPLSPSAASCRWSIQSHAEQRNNSPPGERRYEGNGRAYTTPAHSGHSISVGRPWGTPSPSNRAGIYPLWLGERAAHSSHPRSSAPPIKSTRAVYATGSDVTAVAGALHIRWQLTGAKSRQTFRGANNHCWKLTFRTGTASALNGPLPGPTPLTFLPCFQRLP